MWMTYVSDKHEQKQGSKVSRDQPYKQPPTLEATDIIFSHFRDQPFENTT
jgi:hypothetical protein